MIIHAHTNIAAAESLAAELREGASAEAFICDLTDFAATEAALQTIVEQGAPHRGQPAGEGEESGVPHHLLHRAHALPLHVPGTVQRLQRLHVAAAVRP